MFQKVFSLIFAGMILFGGTSFVMAEEPGEAEEQCRQMAKEDEVPKEELEDYIKECIQSQGEAGEKEGPSDN